MRLHTSLKHSERGAEFLPRTAASPALKSQKGKSPHTEKTAGSRGIRATGRYFLLTINIVKSQCCQQLLRHIKNRFHWFHFSYFVLY